MDEVLYVICFLFPVEAVVTLLIEPPARNRTTSQEKGRLFGPLNPEVECIKPTYRNISYTTLQLFKFTIGMGDMEFTEHYKYKEVFYMLLITYIILTYILLLNMLIALMNRTVEKTAMESASIWKLQVRCPQRSSMVRVQVLKAAVCLMECCDCFQRAITILDMEKRLPCCLKRRFRCGVEKNLDTSLGDNHRWCFRFASFTSVTIQSVSHDVKGSIIIYFSSVLE